MLCLMLKLGVGSCLWGRIQVRLGKERDLMECRPVEICRNYVLSRPAPLLEGQTGVGNGHNLLPVCQPASPETNRFEWKRTV